MDAEFSISVRPNPSHHLDSSERGEGEIPSVPLHRCRFPDFTPSSITCLALTPTSFNSSNLNCGVDEKEGGGGERGILAVGRSNGQVELMIWGGVQGWVNWRTLPNSFPLPPTQGGGGKKPSPSLLSHLTWTHQTSLSSSDLSLYSDDLQEAQREIESLKRGKGLRLFGVGGIASELVEWEWKSGPGQSSVGMIKSTLPTLPPIFALTSSPTSSTLAISCEDSTIRLINILDGDLELISKIELGGGGIGGGKVRALSLTWGEPRPFEQEEEEEEENKLPLIYSTRSESYLLAGCSNSTIRRFDAPRNNNKGGPYRGTLRMTLDRLKGEHTVVWALTTLRDGTIVSGDSMGNVKFWDGTMGTQLQSFKSHKSDVLCLGVGTDGQSIFTSGIDQKTVEFRKVSVNRTTTTSSTLSSTSRWIQSSGRRLHSHDVRAIVISPPYEPFSTSPCSSSSSIVPVMTSAGLDLSLILTPVASPPPTTSRKQREEFVNPVSNNPSIQFESTVHRRQSYVPMRSNLPFSVSTKPSENGRLLIARRDRSVGIWRLGQPNDPRAGGGGWEKLIDLEFKLQTNLISSGISPNGKWFAVSDLYETKLYKLTTSQRSGDLTPRRQKTFVSTLASSISTSLGTGSHCIEFSKDSKKLFLSSAFGSNVAVVELSDDEEEEGELFKVVAVFGQGSKEFQQRQNNEKKNDVNGGGDIEMNGQDSEDEESHHDDEDDTPTTGTSSIVVLTCSDDGKYLATADLDRRVEIYDLTTNKHLLTLPTPPSIPTALCFLPSSSSSSSIEPTLLLTFSTNILLLFGITSRRFHPWSLPLSSSKYNTLTDIREPCLGVTFEPTPTPSSLVALVWGANWVAKIDLKDLMNTNFGINNNNVNGGGINKKKTFRLEADRKRAREEDEVLLSTSTTSSSPTAIIDIKVTRKYQPLFLFDFIQPTTTTSSSSNSKKDSSSSSSSSSGASSAVELIAVERTWYDLVGELPDAFLQSGVFGT